MNTTKYCSIDYCKNTTTTQFCSSHTCRTLRCIRLANDGYKYCPKHTCGFPKCREQRDMKGLWILMGNSPSKHMSYFCEEHDITNIRRIYTDKTENKKEDNMEVKKQDNSKKENAVLPTWCYKSSNDL